MSDRPWMAVSLPEGWPHSGYTEEQKAEFRRQAEEAIKQGLTKRELWFLDTVFSHPVKSDCFVYVGKQVVTKRR